MSLCNCTESGIIRHVQILDTNGTKLEI